MTRLRRITTLYGTIAAALLAAWLACALLFAPWIIREGYAERSLGLVNRVFDGRSVHDVDHYLSHWASLAKLGTFALLALIVALYVVLVFHRRIGQALRLVLNGRTGARVPRRDFLMLAVFFGLIGGYAEAAGAMGKAVLEGMPHYGVGYSAEVVWMSPLANALLYALVAAILLIATVRMKNGVPLHGTVLLFVAAATYIAFKSLRVGLHPVAVGVLGLGVAVQSARWAEHHVGSFRRFVWRGTAVLGFAVLVTAGVMGFVNRARFPSVAAAGRHRNVILIILDTVRSHNLSLYGYERPTTPFLAKLGTRAAVFDHAISTASWTLPSHATMFTGHYPFELGADWEARLDDRYPTLAEYLGQQGYRTGGFVANTIFAGGRTGLDRGFQYYDDQAINLPMLISNSWMARKLVSKATGQLEMPWGTWGRKNAEDVNASFIDWLDHTGDRPFFAFLNYLDAHHPYHVQEPFDTRFSEKLPDARLAWDNLYTYQELENFKLSYDNAIAYLDAQLDTLFGELERRGVLENTIVVIASDHGEQLGEQRREAYGHGNSLYASSIEVPLLIYAPDAGVRATRIERTVTLRDLAATITDLLDMDGEAPFPGESLADLWKDNAAAFAGASPVLSELSLSRGFGTLVPSWQGHTRSITSGAFHYIANGDGTEEMFDIDTDPWELDNVVADSADHSQLARLRSILAAVPRKDATAAVAAREP